MNNDIAACISVAMQRSREESCCGVLPLCRNVTMRCLVTTGNHNNNTRAITRQLLGKRVPAATDTHATAEVLLDYSSGNGAFYVVRAEIL